MKKYILAGSFFIASCYLAAQPTDTLALLINHHILSANYNAIAKLKNIAQQTGSNAARYQLAKYYLTNKSPDSAIQILEKCTNTEEVRFALAQAYIQIEEKANVFYQLQQSIHQHGRPFRNQILKDSIFAKYRNTQSFMQAVNELQYTAWAADLGEIDYQIQLNKYETAEKLINQFLNTYPDRNEIYLQQGLLLLKQQDTLNALSHWLLIEYKKIPLPVAEQMANLLIRTNHKKAYVHCEQLLKAHPYSTHIFKTYIQAAVLSHNILNNSELNIARIICETDAESLAALGEYYLRQEEDAMTALKYLSAAIALEPAKSNWLFLRAEIYKNGQSLKLAERDLTQVIDHEPKNKDAYTMLGNVKYEMGDLINACAAWRMGATLGSDESQKRLVKNCK